jgi:hypothetical protein
MRDELVLHNAIDILTNKSTKYSNERSSKPLADEAFHLARAAYWKPLSLASRSKEKLETIPDPVGKLLP